MTRPTWKKIHITENGKVNQYRPPTNPLPKKIQGVTYKDLQLAFMIYLDMHNKRTQFDSLQNSILATCKIIQDINAS